MKNKKRIPLWKQFETSQSERNGFFILFCLLLGLITLSYNTQIFERDRPAVDFSKQRAMAEAFYREKEKPAELFPFNPNTISLKDLQRLGLSYKISDIIVRFRRIGGIFKTKEDFSKIYGMDSAQFQQLVPYITFDKVLKKSKKWESKPSRITPINFDPNTATATQLKQLGLSGKVVKTIVNFRNKKGRFYKPKDLLKIYGISEKDYQLLENYIQIDESNFKKSYVKRDYPEKKHTTKKGVAQAKFAKSYAKSKPNVTIDINHSTPERWQLLYGIGPKLSKRITKFRDKLGGFYSIDQIATVYGLPDSTFQRIKSQLVFSPIFRKLDINSDDINVLKSHPYLSWKKAQILLNYRQNHGDFRDLDDLRKVGIFSEEELERLGAYATGFHP